MTAKNKKSENKKEVPVKKNEPQKKLILCELVEAHPQPNWVIIGALSLAGLLDQYNHELEIYGYEDIEPSITVDELTKIINKFLGE